MTRTASAWERGWHNPRAKIPLRVVAHGALPIGEDYFEGAIRRAVALRREVFKIDAESDGYRLVNSDGDGLSGLTVDRYGEVLFCEVVTLRARELLQPLAQFQFLRHEQFIAEAADFSECGRLYKNKRTGEQFEGPAGAVPQLRDAASHEVLLIQPHCRSPGEAFAGYYLLRHILKKSRARM